MNETEKIRELETKLKEVEIQLAGCKEALDEEIKEGIERGLKEVRCPVVMKHKRSDGIVSLSIVYKNRVEDYELTRSASKKEIEDDNGADVEYYYENIYGKGWNKAHEVVVLKNSGYKNVNYKTEVD